VYDCYRSEARLVPTGEIEQYDPGIPFADPTSGDFEATLIGRAFLPLPTLLQLVAMMIIIAVPNVAILVWLNT
jgi:hypothetical protein